MGVADKRPRPPGAGEDQEDAGFRIKKLRKRHVVHAACGVFGGQGWIRTIVRNANGFTVRLL